MLVSSAGFSAMNAGVRYLSADLDAALIVALRNGVTLALLLPVALRHRGALLRTKRIGDHLKRGSIGAIGMIIWTYCLTIMPLNTATALSFTAPLFATLFAVIFLKEKAPRTLWASLFIGFAGALVILHPTPHDFHWSALLVMVATTGWAVVGLLVKSLTRTEPPLRIVFYMNFFMFLWALPVGIYAWQMPTLQQWGILLAVALCSIVMHFSLAKAYSLAPVASLMPLDFTRLVYTALLAWFLFGETSSLTTWLGGAIILASAMLSTRAHRRDVKAALAGAE
jgi:drug/metabolite transporter (DMT)-like permease